MQNSSNVIAFPTTPPFAAPRKRGAASDAEKKLWIASNLPDLVPHIYGEIVNNWRRGVRMAWLAKIHQLRIAQIEAVIWAADNGYGPFEARRAA
jgi:hypothetical protein